MEKSYDKYYVKRNPSNGDILIDGDEPVLGERAKKDCRLEPRHVKILNRGWMGSGVFYKSSEKQAQEDEDKVKSTEALKIEAKEKQEKQDAINADYEALKAQNIELKKALEGKKEPQPKTEARLALEDEAKELKINYRADIGDDKLQEKINEAKK